MSPFVSIEISTYNRKDILREVLDRLAEQTYPMSDFEVVISDDGSSDGLIELVKQLADKLPYHLQILRNERKGVGHNHNAGIKACRGELVVMLAADILAEPQLLAEFVAAHQADPDPALFVAGQIRQAPPVVDTVFQRAFDVLVDKLFDDQLKGLHVPHFWVSNISFKKQFMLEHGMFREWLYAAGEDIELGYRLRSAGMKLVKNPRAIGYHYHEVTPESIALRSYSTGYYRYLLTESISDPEFLQKVGKSPDQSKRSVASRLKGLVRRCVENRVTVRWLVMPLIHMAERVHRLAPLVPLLTQRMSAYYIHRGARDQEQNIPFDPFQAKIYPTDPG